jgi:hypothetical protein
LDMSATDRLIADSKAEMIDRICIRIDEYAGPGPVMGRGSPHSLRFGQTGLASVQDAVRVAGCELVRMRLPMAWCKIRRLTAGIPQRITMRFQGIGIDFLF